MSPWECSCSSFPVDPDLSSCSINVVLFYFCYVVGYVVDKLQAEFLSRLLKDLFEALSDPVHNHLPVYKGEIYGASHRLVVVLSLIARSWRAS